MIFLVELRNEPGSLCRFLGCLVSVNLVGLTSCPVHGHVGTMFFLFEAESESPDVERTVEQHTIQSRRLPEWPPDFYTSGYLVPMAPKGSS